MLKLWSRRPASCSSSWTLPTPRRRCFWNVASSARTPSSLNFSTWWPARFSPLSSAKHPLTGKL
ncbi:Methyltransferase 9-like protein [Daphnia magna]|uniref:Methyltransferase 9-like protein n=1 Tax=Daphnia magna TaxID=35525 RepID=A0A164R8F0_9CRUS|nr:Methyltransferase 9-like protein [Daphnia magna]